MRSVCPSVQEEGNRGARILYVLREDLREPLIKSQVLAYLRGLQIEYDVTVLDLRKAEPGSDGGAENGTGNEGDFCRLRRISGRFRKGRTGLSGFFNLLDLTARAVQQVRVRQIQLVHARSYLPGIAAWVVWRVLGIPYIFDMRGLWPEELVVSGKVWSGSLIYRCLLYAEKVLVRDAAGVVSLTHAAAEHLREYYPHEVSRQRVAVIPTCADLERFRPNPPAPEAAPVYGCIGTVLSGWFRTDWLSGFFHTLAVRDPNAWFEVVTRDDSGQVRRDVDPNAALGDRLSVYALSPEAMHTAVQRQRASVMFFAEGLSKLGSSPTRMGEVLGCGIPVVANEGVGDVSRIIRRYGVGVIVADGSDHAMAAAASELEALLQDPALADRCRRAAEEVFSLEAGTEAYRALYRQILGEATPAQAGSVDE